VYFGQLWLYILYVVRKAVIIENACGVPQAVHEAQPPNQAQQICNSIRCMRSRIDIYPRPTGRQVRAGGTGESYYSMDQPKTVQFVPARFLESFIAVARELIFRPRGFFEQLRPSGSLFGPLTFLCLCLFLNSLFVANATGANLPLFAALLASGAVAAVLGTLCLHAMLASPLFNARFPYEATLSVVAYASIVDLVAWIPLVDIFANIYGLYLLYLGFKTIHQLSGRRAVLAVVAAVVMIGIIRLAMIQLTAPEWLAGLIQAIETRNAS